MCLHIDIYISYYVRKICLLAGLRRRLCRLPVFRRHASLARNASCRCCVRVEKVTSHCFCRSLCGPSATLPLSCDSVWSCFCILLLGHADTVSSRSRILDAPRAVRCAGTVLLSSVVAHAATPRQRLQEVARRRQGITSCAAALIVPASLMMPCLLSSLEYYRAEKQNELCVIWLPASFAEVVQALSQAACLGLGPRDC